MNWALEVFTFFFANLVGVILWRGIWYLLDLHFLPHNPGLSAGMTHLMGIVVLWLMQCAHSVTMSGCDLDGEAPFEEACLSPNYYLRVIFTRPNVSKAAVGRRKSNEFGMVNVGASVNEDVNEAQHPV